MSFPKARTKRFNEIKSFAPPVGLYDIGQDDKVPNIAFDKEMRFRDSKEIFGSGEITMIHSGSASSLHSAGSRSPSAKLLRPGTTTSRRSDLTKQRQLEADIRKLLRERIELDHTVEHKDGQVQKLEGKLVKVTKEKTEANARIASLEKEIMQLYRSNVTLKKEANQSDTTSEERKKMYFELTHLKSELNLRDIDIEELKKQVVELKAQLKANMAESEKNVHGLKRVKGRLELEKVRVDEEKKLLEIELLEIKEHEKDLLEEKESLLQKIKLDEERQQDLEAEMERVTSESEKKMRLVEESIKQREELLNERIDMILDKVRIDDEHEVDFRSCLQSYREVLEAEIDALKEDIRFKDLENAEQTDFIRHLKGEVFAANDEMLQQKDELFRAELELGVVREALSQSKQSEELSTYTLSSVTDKYTALETHCAELEAEVQGHDAAETDTLEEECDSLMKAVRTAEYTKQELAEKLHHFELVFKDIQSDKERLEKQVESLEKNVADMSADHVSSQGQITYLKQDLLSSGKQRSTLQSKYTVLTTTMSNTESRIEMAEASLTGALDEKQSLERKVIEVENAVKDLEMSRAALSEKLSEANQLSEEQEQSLSAKEGLINSLQVEVNENESRLTEVKDESRKIRVQLNEMSQVKVNDSRMREQQQELGETVSSLRECVSRKEKEVLLLRDMNEQLRLTAASSDKQQLMTKEDYKQSEQLWQHQQQQYEKVIAREAEVKKELTHALDKLMTQLSYSEENVSDLTQQLHLKDQQLAESKNNDITALESKISELNETKQALSQLEEKYTRQEQETNAEFDGARDKLSEVKQMLSASVEKCNVTETRHQQELASERKTSEKRLAETNTLLEQSLMKLSATEAEMQCAVDEYQLQLRKQYLQHEESVSLLEAELQAAPSTSDTTELQAELDKWRNLYEQLFAKVEPFQDQLEAFQMEKDALLGLNKNAKSDLDKLGRDYVKLLGHQNQKQKIKHVLKLKEENNQLKSDISRLREQAAKQTRQVKKLEEKLSKSEPGTSTSRTRFNPSKAFAFGKENADANPARSPLRAGNRM